MVQHGELPGELHPIQLEVNCNFNCNPIHDPIGDPAFVDAVSIIFGTSSIIMLYFQTACLITSQQKPLLVSIFKNLPFECSHQSLLISVPVFVLFQLFLRLPWVDSKERYHVHMGLLHVG